MSVHSVDANADLELDYVAKWRIYQLQILKELRTHGKVIPQYKLSASQRCGKKALTTGVALFCCAPCLAWDFLCCGLNILVCGQNPVMFGCTILSMAEDMKKADADDRQDMLNNAALILAVKNNIPVFLEVVRAFYAAMLGHIDMKNAADAMRANVIRSYIVDMLRIYTPGFDYITLPDDGDLLQIQRIIMKELPAKAQAVSFKRRAEGEPVAAASD